jgi:hypothetical protein
LFEYFICRLMGGFSESRTLFGLQLFTIGLFFPMFGGGRKSVLRLVVPAMFALLLPFVFGIDWLSNIYVDVVLGVLFGCGVYQVLACGPRGAAEYAGLFLVGFTLTLAKPSGLFLTIELVLLLGVSLAVDAAKKALLKGSRRLALRDYVVRAGLLAAAAAFAYLSWRLVLKASNITSGQFNIGRITLPGVLDLFRGRAGEAQRITLYNFAITFFELPLVTSLALSFGSLLLASLLLIYALYLLLRGEAARRRLLSFLVDVPLIAAAYAASLLLLYLFSFSDYEAVKLPRSIGIRRRCGLAWRPGC